MAQYDGSIRINTLLNTSGLRRGEGEIRGSMSRISDAAKKMATVIAGAFAVGKIVQFGKGALDAASDFEAMEAQFSQVFGELEASASESLSKIAKDTGITEERMKSSYTKIAAFAKTTGMDTASSLELADRAMMAVADSAAFYDRSLEETTESLQSFLKGNYENDAALGLSATEFTRNAAANKLYGKSFIELSEAQKQLTLLQMVEDANMLSGAMGQASRESDTWTNQTGNLNQAWTNLKANIGKFVLPLAIKAVKAVSNVINAINTLLAKLYVAASAFRAFSELITGNKSQSGTSSGLSKSEGEDISSGYNAAADGAEKLAEANEDVAKSAGKATKATKGQLSALDKLNNLSSQNSDSGGGFGGFSSGISGVTEDVDYGKVAEGETQFEKLSRVLDAIISKVKELAGLFKLGFFDGIGDWKYRWESIKTSVASIKDVLIDVWTDPAVLLAADSYNKSVAYMLGSLIGSAASIGSTVITNLFGGISKYLEQNKERIKEFIASMFDIGAEINQLIAEFSSAFAFVFEAFGSEDAQKLTANIIGIFSDAVMGSLELIGKLAMDILNIFIQPFVDNKEKFRTALEGFLGVLSEVTGTIKQGVEETFDKLNKVYDEHLKPFFDSVAEGLSDTAGKFMEFWNGNVQPILNEWAKGFDKLWKKHIQPMLNKFVLLIGKVADLLKSVWENILKPLIDWIIKNVLPVILPIIKGIGDAIGSAFALISDVVGGIFDIFGGLIDFITGVFSGDWGKAWDGIVGVFKGIFNLIPTIIEGILNTAIGIINGLIGGINKLTGAVGIPSIPSIPKVSIPRLATGAVIPANKEFLAVLGDQKHGTNIEAPLSTIEQAVENVLKRSGNSGGDIVIHVNAEVDGKTLFQIVQRYDREQVNSTGNPSFVI